MGTKRWSKIILVPVVVVLAALTVGGYLAWSRGRPVNIEPAVSRFQANPCQATADALTRLIDSGRLTGEQAGRILRLLLWPKVTTRTAYPLGRKPIVSIEHPFSIRFENTILTLQETVRMGKLQSTLKFDTDNLTTSPRLVAFEPAPNEPGRYKMEIEYTCSITTNPFRPWPFPLNLLPRRTVRPRKPQTPVPECRFDLPVEIVVVEREKAEKITYVSNPELDKAMRAAFTCQPLSIGCSYGNRPNRLRATGGIMVFCNNLPADVGFKRVLELTDGRRIPERPHMYGVPLPHHAGDPHAGHERDQPIHCRAGRSDYFYVYPFWIQQPGQYDLNIVLVPDPNTAYEDPAIKSIWKGELKFPISITVTRRN
ncbi:MAG: hypothetical protein ACYS83_08305 [Planctomycetota bacterium]|jgi:hypothetical protein